MNKHIIPVVMLCIFSGCKEKPTSPESHSPNIPSAPLPSDSATGVSVNVALSWACSDPDTGDSVFYNLYFDTVSTPSLVSSNICSSTYTPGLLAYETSYYWKVVAKDNHDNTTSGPVWMFTTRASTNQSPYIPKDPSPSDSATQQTVNLTLLWSGGDPDSGDVVTYDIYLDTLSPPSISVPNHSSISYTPGILEFATRYYWKIIAKDAEGDTSAGPIWTFTTEDTMVVVAVLSAPATEPTGLTWDGEHLWVSDSIEKKIYSIDTSSASVVNCFSSPGGAPTGLAWDGTHLWVSSCSTYTIYKVNASSGGVIDSFPSPDSCPMGLAWRNSTSLWHSGANDARIFEINPTVGSIIRSFSSPGSSPAGLTWDGKYLWICDSATGRIYKVSTSSGLSEQSFPTPGNSPTGLTWDGSYMWNADTQTEKIYKLLILTAP